MIRAVILVESGFQDEEFVYPYYRMLEEGWQVVVATPNGKSRSGKYGVPTPPCRRGARVGMNQTYRISNLKADNYEAVIIPGGYESPDRLRTNEYALAFVRSMWNAGKLIAAICHGPWVLISAGICKGRRMTGYGGVKIDLQNSGAKVPNGESVVIDRNIITAEHYLNNPDFMRAVTLWMAHKKAVAHV